MELRFENKMTSSPRLWFASWTGEAFFITALATRTVEIFDWSAARKKWKCSVPFPRDYFWLRSRKQEHMEAVWRWKFSMRELPLQRLVWRREKASRRVIFAVGYQGRGNDLWCSGSLSSAQQGGNGKGFGIYQGNPTGPMNMMAEHCCCEFCQPQTNVIWAWRFLSEIYNANLIRFIIFCKLKFEDLCSKWKKNHYNFAVYTNGS